MKKRKNNKKSRYFPALISPYRENFSALGLEYAGLSGYGLFSRPQQGPQQSFSQISDRQITDL